MGPDRHRRANRRDRIPRRRGDEGRRSRARYGSAVVAAAQPLIEAGADVGFLATGSQPFYERLGWVRWRGPSEVREPDGTVTPTPEEDPFIMALRFEHTPAWMSEDLAIVRPRRDPDEAW